MFDKFCVMMVFVIQIQQIVPDEEFPSFIEAIQRKLPSTFRITGTRR